MMEDPDVEAAVRANYARLEESIRRGNEQLAQGPPPKTFAELQKEWGYENLHAKGDRWLAIFCGLLVATLLMIGICDMYGVGHFWPFPVLATMIGVDLAVLVKVLRSI